MFLQESNQRCDDIYRSSGAELVSNCLVSRFDGYLQLSQKRKPDIMVERVPIEALGTHHCHRNLSCTFSARIDKVLIENCIASSDEIILFWNLHWSDWRNGLVVQLEVDFLLSGSLCDTYLRSRGRNIYSMLRQKAQSVIIGFSNPYATNMRLRASVENTWIDVYVSSLPLSIVAGCQDRMQEIP
jgi:hypothetical protein